MATTFDELDDLVTANEAASETSGKFFAIDVPDYEDAVKSASSDKRSYLRLGAADPDWTGEPGADLIALAYLTGPTGRESADSGGYAPLAEADNVVSALSATLPGLTPGDVGDMFIDDQRERGAGNERAEGAPGHGFTEDERRAISANLHKDVGWRDHTDGNRISTTRGDKVEVVYGNYKLVVLGRQTNPDFAQGWEADGNQVQDWADGTMPGASVTVEWVPNTTYGKGNEGDTPNDVAQGAWLLQNSTERVYQYSRYAGNFRDQRWGDLHETYTGSENPESIGTTERAGLTGHPRFRDKPAFEEPEDTSELSPAPSVRSIGLPRGNPRIVERTWATKIDSQRGSEKVPVPEIKEVTHAGDIFERVFAKKVDRNNGTAGNWIGYLSESSWAGLIENYKISGLVIDMSTAGLVINAFMGPRLVLELAASVQITGLFKVEATLGKKFSFHNFEDEATLAKNELSLIRTMISNTDASVIDRALELNRLQTRVHQTEVVVRKMGVGLDETETHLSKMTTNISKLCVKTGVQFLG